MKTTSTSSSPAAYLAVGRDKNRLKIYGNQKVYLQDGQEFLIELHNPTQDTVGAKVFINGKAISERMIVLRPGERDHLLRHIESDNKFVFNTYKVEDTAEAKAATANNGYVKVEFYREQRPQPNIGWGSTNTFYVSPTTGSPYMGPTFTTSGGDGTLYRCAVNNTGSGDIGSKALFSQDMNDASFCHDGQASLNEVTQDNVNKVETGRVEAGAASGQQFGTYYGNFEYWSFANSEYQILPVAQQPVEVSKMRQYCPGCGQRIRKSSWNFCPHCRTELR